MAERLNWGCADVQPAGWVNLDRDPAWRPGVVNDTILDPLPYDDDAFELIVANHSLQMVPWHYLGKVLREWRRVLAPTGTARVLVPDTLRAIRAFFDEEAAWFPVADHVAADIGAKLSAYLCWYSEARVSHTFDSLVLHLTAAGFEHVQRCEYGRTVNDEPAIVELDSRRGESLIVEAW